MASPPAAAAAAAPGAPPVVTVDKSVFVTTQDCLALRVRKQQVSSSTSNPQLASSSPGHP